MSHEKATSKDLELLLLKTQLHEQNVMYVPMAPSSLGCRFVFTSNC
ncbi:hypothetical protein Cflav_PD5819 [Pedosphaera parvula Ellin514]|uniref:Uncharacterized protein n=1 Tax=Pedosphaera parvula (strain Ellin514) TaxID=320771 RepID=B9XAZ9_PEDPL|nr:hypothetical protein Cflav_PD5819 [Pedosphaera parvula Ellin514]